MKRQGPSRKADMLRVAASLLFLEQGFDAVTMDALARAAGVSKATLYLHFKSKDALFEAVVADEIARVNDGIWPAALEEAGDVADTLRKAARNFFAVFMNERTFRMQRAVVGAIPHCPSLGRFVADMGPSALVDRIAVFLAGEHAGRRLHTPNPKLAAAQFLSLAHCDIQTIGFLSLETPSQGEIDEKIESAVDIFMSYYGHPHHS